MQIYRILSALLSYPQPELIAALPEIRAELAVDQEATDALQPLLNYLQESDLISVQENYVGTFDRTPSVALHLFEHIHGESRDRGQAMVDLISEYRRYGFEPEASELPDYVPLFLEAKGYTAQEVWNRLIPTLELDQKLEECQVLVDWLRVALTAVTEGQDAEGQVLIRSP